MHRFSAWSLGPVLTLLIFTGCEPSTTSTSQPPAPRSASRVQQITADVTPPVRVQAAIGRAQRAAWAPAASVIAGWPAPRVHDVGRGAIVVSLPETVNGMEVMGRATHVVLDRSHQPVAVSGSFQAPPVVHSHQLDARRAASAALARLGVVIAPRGFRSRGDQGRYARFDAEASGLTLSGPIRVKPVYFDGGEGIHPAYYVEYSLTVKDQYYSEGVVISADDGRVLRQNTKRHDAEPFSYRVWANDADFIPESTPYCGDGIPHPTGTPAGYLPDAACPARLVQPPANGVSGPWLDDDATETLGNNVDAFFRNCFDTQGRFLGAIEFDATLGDFRATTTGVRTFDYPYDLDRSPDDCAGQQGPHTCAPTSPQLNAKIVQNFYTANYLHDLMYRHGFDEASGNAQADNFGRGGEDGDPLLVGAGSCTTYVTTFADGRSTAMRIGLNTSSGLARDATFDLWLFGHEWMHYMQHRLIGDTNGLDNPQGRALGEGWADFFGTLLIVRPEHASDPANPQWQGLFGGGVYFNEGYCDPFSQTCVSLSDDPTYYFGIRRYPYTTDFTKSPLTFRHIENGVPLPSDIPNYVWKGRVDNAEGHNAGEIWASALWHGFTLMMQDGRLTVPEAKDRMFGYLVASMKVTPWNPTFIEARDALLSVAQASDPADYDAFVRGFAARGMGAGAVAPPRDSVEFHGVVESFAVDGAALTFVDATLDVDDAADGDADGIWDVGETAQLRVHLRNTGYAGLTATRVDVAVPGATFADGAERTDVASSPGEDFEVTFPVRLETAEFDEPKTFTLTFEDGAGGVVAQTVSVTFRTHHDLLKTGRADLGDPRTARDWTIEGMLTGRGGYVSQDARWRRLAEGGHRAPPGLGSYTSRLSSPWLRVSADQDFAVEFQQLFNFERPNGENYGAGTVEIRTADSEPEFWTVIGGPYIGRSPNPPNLSAERLDLGRAYAGRVVQVSFLSSFGLSLENPDNGWLVDDVRFSGIDNTPFTEVHPQGSAPGGRRPLDPQFDVAGDAMTFTFSDTTPDDGQIVGRTWTLGDGTTATSNPVEHSYRVPTDAVVTLTVEDDQGAVAVAGRTVTPHHPLSFNEPYPGPFAPQAYFFVDVPADAPPFVVAVRGLEGGVTVAGRFDAAPTLEPFVTDYFESLQFFADAPEERLQMAVPNPRAGRLFITTSGAVRELVVSTEIIPGPPPGPSPGLEPPEEEANCACRAEPRSSSDRGGWGLLLGLAIGHGLRRRRRCP